MIKDPNEVEVYEKIVNICKCDKVQLPIMTCINTRSDMNYKHLAQYLFKVRMLLY